MSKIIIASDSTCDLSPELIKKHDIKIVPLYVNFGTTSYKDRVEMNVDDMYAKVKAEGVYPKTSACTPIDFLYFFKELLAGGNEVVYTGIGSTLSTTFQSAHIALEDLTEEEQSRIHLVDSKNLSTGIGLLVLKACTFREEGDSAKEIAEKLEAIVPKVRSQFVVETLEYLHKGGRCSGMTRFIGTALRMKLLIKVTDGKLDVDKKAIGPTKKAINLMLDDFYALLPDLDKEFLFVTHSNADKNYEYVDSKIAAVKDSFDNIYETKAGCVISSHCGEGCIGILYIEK
ncbi:MAG: DegV family protein [Bacilli bacterium]|nr:DegV family protein [Bacilli bacterium]